jgi:hypothetical protein
MLVLSLLTVLLSITYPTYGRAFAPAPVSDVTQERAEKLTKRAERAEADAAWHEERAKVWAEIATNQDCLKDFASAQEPLAGFLAEMHRNLKEKKLRQALKLRLEAQSLTKLEK